MFKFSFLFSLFEIFSEKKNNTVILTFGFYMCSFMFLYSQWQKKGKNLHHLLKVQNSLHKYVEADTV